MQLRELCIEFPKLARWHQKVLASFFAASLLPVFCIACEKAHPQAAGKVFEECRDFSGLVLQGRTMCFSGRIDSASLEKVRAQLGKFDNFAIVSNGGSFKSSIELAELLRSYDIAIGIVGRCASGCAQYVMLADENVYIGEYAELLVHTKSFDAELYMRRNCENLWPSDERPLPDWKQRQISICKETTADILNGIKVQNDFQVHRPQLRILYNLYDEFIQNQALQLESLGKQGIKQRDVYLVLGKSELQLLEIKNVSPSYREIYSEPLCEILSSGIVFMRRSGCPDIE